MARSRSSFELTSAIATASTLAREEKKTVAPAAELIAYDAKGLVSFQGVDVPPAAGLPTPPAPAADDAPISEPEPLTPPAPRAAQGRAIPPPPPSDAANATGAAGATGAGSIDDLGDEKRGTPGLPDLSNVVSPVVRCEKIVEWIAEATGGSGVFLADADGLPVAGDIEDAEARISAAGLVASSIATLLQALPGEPSPLFEVHVGEGPYFQLIGFRAGSGMYVVGLWRAAPLSPRQAHAVRLACRLAFGESLGGGSAGGKP